MIGADVAAEWTYGEGGDRLGESVALGPGVAIAAPGAETAWVDGVASAGPASWIGWWGDRFVRIGVDGEVYVDDVAAGEVPNAKVWAVGDAGIVWASKSAMGLLDGWEVEVNGVGALAVGTRVVARVGAAVRAWDLDGTEVPIELDAGDGGAVAEWEGVVWAGDPADTIADGAGRVCAEDGRCVDGEPGDHLGRAIGGGYAVGEFNKWIVPARARVVPLDGGQVYAMEVGAEVQPLAVAGDGTRVVVGAPYYPVDGEPAGAAAVFTP